MVLCGTTTSLTAAGTVRDSHPVPFSRRPPKSGWRTCSRAKIDFSDETCKPCRHFLHDFSPTLGRDGVPEPSPYTAGAAHLLTEVVQRPVVYAAPVGSLLIFLFTGNAQPNRSYTVFLHDCTVGHGYGGYVFHFIFTQRNSKHLSHSCPQDGHRHIAGFF